MKIKVLWIDDEPNNSFIDYAYCNNIHIDNAENVDKGIEILTKSSDNYDAIILDANCISHNDGSLEPDIDALSYALKMITTNKIELPWFVYSAGGFKGEKSINLIVRSHERIYDSKDWYKKPTEMYCLFDKIKDVVSKSEEYKIKCKYKDIFSWYQNTKELLDIISYLENNQINDASIFNKIRKELDWVMNYLYTCGFFKEPYKGSNLGECSTFLGNKNLQSIIPLHVQRSMHSTTSICNEGSHNLIINKYVKQGKAPYLVKSTIFEFLNILYWLKDLDNTPTGKKRLETEIEELLSKEETKFDKYEGKDFVVEQDENNNYHCGPCLLSYKTAQNYKEQIVTLYDIKQNYAESKEIYPYFAQFRPKE